MEIGGSLGWLGSLSQYSVVGRFKTKVESDMAKTLNMDTQGCKHTHVPQINMQPQMEV